MGFQKLGDFVSSSERADTATEGSMIDALANRRESKAQQPDGKSLWRGRSYTWVEIRASCKAKSLDEPPAMVAVVAVLQRGGEDSGEGEMKGSMLTNTHWDLLIGHIVSDRLVRIRNSGR